MFGYYKGGSGFDKLFMKIFLFEVIC